MRPPIAMTIAGSDPSGGAGIQADLKTFSALGAYGCACITSLTCQNTLGVRGVHGIGADVVASQVESVIDDLPVDATKIGMLGTAEIVRALARLIEDRRSEFGTVILDPVMVATSGDPLLSDDADAALREELVPLADVITPNLPEAARLLGRPEDVADTLARVREQATELLGLGPRAVLLKGGHLDDAQAVDVLAINPTWSPGHGGFDGEPVLSEFAAPRVTTRNTHGTGCTLSSAIAAYAARDSARLAEHRDDASAGRPAEPHPLRDAALSEAVRHGKSYLTAALEEGASWTLSRTPERGHGPVDHFAHTVR
ncbi:MULTISPECIES: bifunctional hydroxymethylpyrimidine kinase/phosphomethylpyrimidine kinase [Micrococcales]|uniref:bifunctional hydroxymethylpyrimidine kinase/phosphomethylpyrimidine kinase n=1 Tax=Micrococcales TaxID=85006 RepID=UPI0004ABBF27|nr:MULTISPECIES: bifunctional hydroxymethylpyrimidine kinase/phosphomethylpyrimidine kinase [Micrococcales]